MHKFIKSLLKLDLKKVRMAYIDYTSQISNYQKVKSKKINSVESCEIIKISEFKEPTIKLEILFLIPVLIYAAGYFVLIIDGFPSLNTLIGKIHSFILSEIFECIMIISASFHYIFKNIRLYREFEIISVFLDTTKNKQTQLNEESNAAIFILFIKLIFFRFFNFFVLVVCILLSFEISFLLSIGYSPIVEALWYIQGYITYEQYLWHWNYSFEYNIIRTELKLNPFEADLFSNRYAKNRVLVDDSSYELCKTVYNIIYFEFKEI